LQRNVCSECGGGQEQEQANKLNEPT